MAGQGCQLMCRRVSVALLHMCKVFPTLRGKRTIVTSLGDITTMVLTLRVGRYIRRACTSLGGLCNWVCTYASNWVAYHPGSTQTQYWSSKDCNLLVQLGAHRINCNFGEPTDPSSIPKEGHIYLWPLYDLDITFRSIFNLDNGV